LSHHHRWRQGIGRAVAIAFAREGADIVIAYLDEQHRARPSRSPEENPFI
jgi:NAD(P)-dependent dehydrogenase (short-subunit alcohol dehydrogenase family)